MTAQPPFLEMDKPEWLSQMEVVLEVLNEGVIITNAYHRVLFANSRFVEMTDLQRQELIGSDAFHFYSSLERDFLAKQMDVAMLSVVYRQFTRDDEGELLVGGDLTIRDVTRHVVFTVEGPTPSAKDPWGNTRLGASATTKFNRTDFGLTWNAALEAGGILVGDEVIISLDVQFVKA